MEETKPIPSVMGTTAAIKKLLSYKVSTGKIVSTLLPMFTEKGIDESLAKRRIRPLIYREEKKREVNKKK